MSDHKSGKPAAPSHPPPSDATLAATSPVGSPVKLHLTDDLRSVDDDALSLDAHPSPSPDAKHAPNDAIPVGASDGGGKNAEGELEKPILNPTNFWFYPLDVYKKHKVHFTSLYMCIYVCVYEFVL
jgi:hypothetical protein